MKPHLCKTLLAFHIAIEALGDALAAHQEDDGHECPCDRCQDARGILFWLRHTEAILECSLRRPPKCLRRLRAAGFPSARILAQLVSAWQQARRLGTQTMKAPVAKATGPA